MISMLVDMARCANHVYPLDTRDTHATLPQAARPQGAAAASSLWRATRRAVRFFNECRITAGLRSAINERLIADRP
jgi:hypothetical protein